MSNDVHKFYDFCDEIFPLLEKKVFILKTVSAKFKVENKFLKFLFVFFDILYIPFSSYFKTQFDYVFLREFNTIPFLISSILLFPIRRKIILNVNHNFQKAYCSKLHLSIICFLDFLGYKFFLFEGNSTPFSLRRKLISIPFPIKRLNCTSLSETTNEKLKIGFVGSYRDEKKIEELLAKLDSLYEFFEFIPILGTDNSELLRRYADKGWVTFDTSGYESYCYAIELVDVLVFNYDYKSYYYRHSGVLTDAVKKKKIVIAPNYPYFERQLTTPNSVGLLYNNLNGISNCLKNVNLFEPDFESYFEFRSYNNIVKVLNEQLRGL